MFEQEKNNGLLINDLDMSLFKLEKYESVMYTLIDLLRKNDKITSKIFTEINHDANNMINQTTSVYKKQHADICQRYQL